MARLLIVEDEPNMLKLIEMHLRADGHAMVLAASVQEGSCCHRGARLRRRTH